MKSKGLLVIKSLIIVVALFILAAISEKAYEDKKNAPIAAESILEEIPAYKGQVYITINNNRPLFSSEEIKAESFENYSDLDIIGRAGVATACLSIDTMPAKPREYIGEIRPSGWRTVKYPGIIEDEYLYNRCHLIAHSLAGEDANEKNLITGTAYFNTEGMLPFEIETGSYIRRTGNHVMYRVTPVYEGNDLVARGVLMEAYSVEDKGKGIQFCVFVYNIQPGIEIDYSSGDSWESKK